MLLYFTQKLFLNSLLLRVIVENTHQLIDTIVRLPLRLLVPINWQPWRRRFLSHHTRLSTALHFKRFVLIFSFTIARLNRRYVAEIDWGGTQNCGNRGACHDILVSWIHYRSIRAQILHDVHVVTTRLSDRWGTLKWSNRLYFFHRLQVLITDFLTLRRLEHILWWAYLRKIPRRNQLNFSLYGLLGILMHYRFTLERHSELEVLRHCLSISLVLILHLLLKRSDPRFFFGTQSTVMRLLIVQFEERSSREIECHLFLDWIVNKIGIIHCSLVALSSRQLLFQADLVILWCGLKRLAKRVLLLVLLVVGIG